MRVIVAGSRSIRDYATVSAAIHASRFEINELISGGAGGVDAMGEKYAQLHEIPLRIMKADWNTFGKAAGMMRNGQMAEYADALIAVWDGISKGTINMIENAVRRRMALFVLTETQMGANGHGQEVVDTGKLLKNGAVGRD